MRTDNEAEKMKFYEEWGCCYGSKDDFMRAFNYCTAERYQFCYLNLDMGRPQMFKNFTENITTRFFPNLNENVNLQENSNINLSENKNEDNNIKQEKDEP